MAIHVFIDTNILLNFYRFSNEDLDTLRTVFATQEHGEAKVYLTDQVRDEFFRHRDGRIRDSLKQFEQGLAFSVQLPNYMLAYEEAADIDALAKKLRMRRNSLREKVNADIAGEALEADKLIVEVLAKQKIIETTAAIHEAARRRCEVGNPPGKGNKLGDPINWLILLEKVPEKNDLHVISGDGDFFSELDAAQPNSFLVKEWKAKKDSTLRTYKDLKTFLAEHFPGVKFTYDSAKDDLIDDLLLSGSFSMTHKTIEKLEKYKFFTLPEVERILSAAAANNQVNMIIDDKDVSAFLNRVAKPWRNDISEPAWLAIIDKVFLTSVFG